MLEAGVGAWSEHQPPKDCQPGGTGVGDGDCPLRDPGSPGPKAHPAKPVRTLPAQAGPVHQEVTCQTLILGYECVCVSSPEPTQEFLTCLGEQLSLPFPQTQEARTDLACPGLVAGDTSHPGLPWGVIREPCWTKRNLPFWDGMSCFPHRIQCSRIQMVSEGVLRIVRNGKGKCAEGLLGFLPGGLETLSLEQRDWGGCVQCRERAVGGIPG